MTVSRTFSDSHTVIHLATSVPRSDDEPAFLRPAPPYVRSHVHLLAWCIQLPAVPPNATSETSSAAVPTISRSKARIQLFWQWNLKGAVLATHHQQVAALVSSFVNYVRLHSDALPFVASYGRSVEFGSASLDASSDCLTVEYSIVAEDAAAAEAEQVIASRGVDGLAAVKERRRLERAVEFLLSANQGWDVMVSVETQGAAADGSWTSIAERTEGSARVTFRMTHAALELADHLARVRLSIRRLVGGKIIRVNNAQVHVQQVEPRDPSALSRQMLEDTASVHASIQTEETSNSANSLPPQAPASIASNAISTLIRRSYIYFTSLLQEPEAKWRHVSDSRGVTVTQLNSIDPTLTIFRAEATFVGVGVWDVYSTIATPGARLVWDPQTESATLVDDLSELSSLWHMKTKAAWPAWYVPCRSEGEDGLIILPGLVTQCWFEHPTSRLRQCTFFRFQQTTRPSFRPFRPFYRQSFAPKLISKDGRSKPFRQQRPRSPSLSSLIPRVGRRNLGSASKWLVPWPVWESLPSRMAGRRS